MDVVSPAGAEVVSTGHYGHRGLEGKDSVLIEGLNNSNLHREVTRDILVSARENQASTMENRFNNATLIKDAELRSQAHVLQNRVDMVEMKAELAAAVHSDGERTRDLMRSHEERRHAVELADAKDEIAALKAKLGIV